MSLFPEDRNAELRALFFETANELLQSLNEAGLDLEANPTDEEVIRRVRRAVHTLKGDSAACGFHTAPVRALQMSFWWRPTISVPCSLPINARPSRPRLTPCAQ